MIDQILDKQKAVVDSHFSAIDQHLYSSFVRCMVDLAEQVDQMRDDQMWYNQKAVVGNPLPMTDQHLCWDLVG